MHCLNAVGWKPLSQPWQNFTYGHVSRRGKLSAPRRELDCVQYWAVVQEKTSQQHSMTASILQMRLHNNNAFAVKKKCLFLSTRIGIDHRTHARRQARARAHSHTLLKLLVFNEKSFCTTAQFLSCTTSLRREGDKNNGHRISSVA